MSSNVRAAPFTAGQRPPRPDRGAAISSGWLDEYALAQQSHEYMSTDEQKVFVDLASRQTIIFRGEQPFTVRRDPNDGNWYLMALHDPTRRGPRIRLDARGEWQIEDGARQQRAAGEAGTAVPPPGVAAASNAASASPARTEPEHRLVEFLLRYPGYDPAEVARGLGLSHQQSRAIASDVEAAKHAWRELQRPAVQIRPTVIVAPLSAREQQYILKWATSMSLHSLVEITRTPPDVILAFLEKSGGAARPSGQNLPGEGEFRRAFAEWRELIRADASDGQHNPRFSVRNEATAFVREWQGRLSASNVVTLMTLYPAMPDAHQPPAGRAAASEPVARAGPSGHQGPLDEAQQAVVIDLNRRGMSPSAIAAYVGKPRATIEAFLRERSA